MNMKPKKNNQVSKANDSNNNKSAKIQSYFKNVPKPTPQQQKNTKSFYVEVLKKRVEKDGTEDGTKETVPSDDGANVMLMDVEDGSEAKTTPAEDNANAVVFQETHVNQPECSGCKEWENKYQELKKKYFKLTARFTEVDMKFEDLVKTKTQMHTCQADTDCQISDGVFTPSEVKYLQTMPLEKSKDSSFILKCLEFAYKNDTSVLRLKTLKGKTETILFDEAGEMEEHAKKDPLTPIKVQRINALFIERLSKCKIDSVAYAERVKEASVNRLFAAGIRNIVKKLK